MTDDSTPMTNGAIVQRTCIMIDGDIHCWNAAYDSLADFIDVHGETNPAAEFLKRATARYTPQEQGDA